jgi:hypothetical protein
MSRGAQAFKQNDVKKAIKGAVNAGLAVSRVEIEGKKIVVFADRPDDQSARPSEWDDVK